MSNKKIRIQSLKLALIAATFCVSAGAQSQELGQVLASKQKTIAVYDVPGGASVAKLAAEGLPWVIREEKDDFFLVTLNGRKVWVDSMDVRAARPSSDKCELVDTNFIAGSTAAGSPGASARRCK